MGLHKRSSRGGTSLAVQQLRLHLSVQGVGVQSLVRKLRSHMPHSQKKKEEEEEAKLKTETILEQIQ